MSSDMNYSIQGTVRSLKDVTDALKRQNKSVKDLRERKKKYETELLEWMDKMGVQEYEGIKREKLCPQRKPRKKASDKDKDAIALFEKVGITDPYTLLAEFKKTQKYLELPSNEEGVE